MGERTAVDITQYSFEEFVSFLFDRDVQSLAEQLDRKKWDPWYWHLEVTFGRQRVCEYYVRLFRQPAFLLGQFSTAQLEKGFWGIQVANLDCSAYRIIFDTELPVAAREECTRSMFDLFRYFFAVEPLEGACNMWWDSLCYDWTCGNRKRENGGEDLLLQDVMFETIAKILDLDSEPCQRSALHGLGHLHHPDTEELVQRFIDRHRSLANELRYYALAA
ncbi:MAG TPA: hypothetical protein VJX30_09710, partial [Terriglobales bacterium]|nr:hypothetical protein [Terriglobales bacterium]